VVAQVARSRDSEFSHNSSDGGRPSGRPFVVVGVYAGQVNYSEGKTEMHLLRRRRNRRRIERLVATVEDVEQDRPFTPGMAVCIDTSEATFTDVPSVIEGHLAEFEEQGEGGKYRMVLEITASELGRIQRWRAKNGFEPLRYLAGPSSR
jgi:hypothetical protein